MQYNCRGVAIHGQSYNQVSSGVSCPIPCASFHFWCQLGTNKRLSSPFELPPNILLGHKVPSVALFQPQGRSRRLEVSSAEAELQKAMQRCVLNDCSVSGEDNVDGAIGKAHVWVIEGGEVGQCWKSGRSERPGCIPQSRCL